MSRSGYSSDHDSWDLIRWRGQVASAMRGRRGQRLLIDLVEALDVMPEKRLIANDLIRETGEVCALGAIGLRRGIVMWDIDPEEPEEVAAAFDVASCLAAEIAFINDEAWYGITPEERWVRMRNWAVEHLLPIEDMGPQHRIG